MLEESLYLQLGLCWSRLNHSYPEKSFSDFHEINSSAASFNPSYVELGETCSAEVGNQHTDSLQGINISKISNYEVTEFENQLLCDIIY